MIHSNPTRTVEQRRCLDQLHSAHTSSASLPPDVLNRGHVSVLMKAAKCCHHPTIVLWLLQTFYPPPPFPPTSPTPWPRNFELAFDTITASVHSRYAPSEPQLLADFFHLLSQHNHPVLPSMLTPALLFYRHYEAWPLMLSLHEHCRAHSVPISHTAYPLLLVATNHTRQWRAALDFLSQAESTLLPYTPLPRLYPIYHAAIDALGTSHHTELALDVYNRMRAKGLPPREETFTAIIGALGQSAKGGKVDLQLVQQMHAEVEAAQVSMTQPLYRALIRAYLRFDAAEAVMPLLQRLVQLHHDASSHFFVLSVCLQVENVEAALLMLDKVKDRREDAVGTSPRKLHRQVDWTVYVSVYNRVLDLCVRMRKWKAVKQVWDMRDQLRVQPDVVSFYLAAQALKPQSASWQMLMDNALSQLSVESSASTLSLTVSPTQADSEAAASLYWVLKAMQAKYADFDQRELIVHTTTRARQGIDRIVQGMGLMSGKWSQDGVVRWTRESLDEWKQGGVRAVPQSQPHPLLDYDKTKAVENARAEERDNEQRAAELTTTPQVSRRGQEGMSAYRGGLFSYDEEEGLVSA